MSLDSDGRIGQPDRPSSVMISRRRFLQGSVLVASGLIAWECGRLLLDGRRQEGEEGAGEPFDELPDGTPLIGRRILMPVTLTADAAHVEIQLLPCGNGELMIAIEGEQYELPEKQLGSDEPLTKLVKNVTKQGCEIHVHCGIGTAHVTAEELGNAAYLFKSKASDQQPRVTASFSLTILPKTRTTGNYPVSLRKSERH